MESGHPTDVLVVGCGVIGASIAWRLARAGLTVRCLDPAPGDGATHAAAGMLAAVAESRFGEHDLMRLNVESAAHWPSFAAELEAEVGMPVGLRHTGTLTVAFDSGDRQELRRLRDLQHQWGLESFELNAAEARAREPSLGPRVAGAVWTPGDHQVDPRAVHAALLSALYSRRVDVVRRQVSGLVVGESRSSAMTNGRIAGDAAAVTGVVDDAGDEHCAGTVVLAAGWNSRALTVPTTDLPAHPAREHTRVPVELVVPTRPVKGQIVRLDARHEPTFHLSRVVRGIVQGRDVYLVGRDDGEIVIGATSEEQPDDRVVTAGGLFSLLRDARALVPGVDELPVVELTARARPGSPDNMPLVGASGVAGLVLATGHHRNGILQAPLTAAAVLAHFADRDLPAAVMAASPTRFRQPVTDENGHRPIIHDQPQLQGGRHT